ncbi:E3 ubiquitin-protein ligase ATL42-like [Cynara cardunculus var. scolymus]|uniref:RING-type E3 ubiquitin transferase n=1 Tax=Cynara cardunculus var. scolymus TaxID=59895 RepID=A0A103XNI0_CYNCS|nr:E3 ubiquitin-protein ligase ATL42-like [Cynara cardunculus var. scolymus]KVH93883.1 Zinc finger, RING/FYVE/PHD-type [Cynara cardunculus var. scolymus]
MNFPATRLPEFLGIPVTQQNKLDLIMTSVIILIIISSHPTNSQSLSSSPTTAVSADTSNSPDSVTNFQPSLAVVIGVLAIMFILTFCLLIYAKCCHRASSPRYLNQENFGDQLPRSLSRVSGVDKTVIESLPFFRFSTLKGWRNGLECSICLSKFEDIEILRLLPKCKHAFHIDCVDRWLEKHSGCPLCRCKVSEEDAALFAYSSSLRFLSNQSDRHRAHEGSNLELFIEREGSARFGSRRSFSKLDHEQREMKNQEILEGDHDQDQETLHKFNHRIIISDYDQHGLMMKNRWSNMSPSDLLFLKSEMITSLSSNILDDHHHHHEMITSISSNILDHQPIKIKEEIKRKREFEMKIKRFPGGNSDIEPKSTKLTEKRSMSEIIVHPRFLDVESSNHKEERLKRLWLPIARRTVQWFASRDQRSQINTQSQV